MQMHNVMVSIPGKQILVREVSCYEKCCWDSTTLMPRLPQLACTSADNDMATFKFADLFNKEILAKLQKKKKDILKERKEKEKLEVRK